MSNPAAGRLSSVVVPAGPDGIAVLRPALERAWAGTGDAVAPLPDTGRLVSRAAVDAARRALHPDDDAAPLAHPDVVAVVATSGSTGDPKGVHWTRAGVRHATESLHSRLSGAGTWVVALPLTSAAGAMALLRSIVAGTPAHATASLGGASAFTVEDFVQTTDRAVAEGGPTYVSLIDEQLRRVVDSLEGRTALARYDAVIVGGGPVSHAVDEARSHGVRIVTSYGMTETCGGCWYDDAPLPGVEVDITDDGRVRISGPVVSPGYRLRHDDDLRGGTFVTRDLGRMEGGRLRITGRIDDAVKIDGVLVDLAAVERVARDVTSASVVVARVDATGRGLEVVVEADEVATQEVVAAARERLAVRISAVLMVQPESLPRLPGGKVDVRRVREPA